MESEKLIEIAKNRNELDFLYNITKLCAETDSIGEGYNYCDDYERVVFEGKENKVDGEISEEQWGIGKQDDYVYNIGLPIYELYLKQIKAI